MHFALFTGTSCPLSSSFNLDPGQPRTVFPLDSSGKHILLTATLELRILSGQDFNYFPLVLPQEESTRTSRSTCADRSPGSVSGCWAGMRRGSLWVRRRVRRLVWQWAWNPVIFSSLNPLHTLWTPNLTFAPWESAGCGCFGVYCCFFTVTQQYFSHVTELLMCQYNNHLTPTCMWPTQSTLRSLGAYESEIFLTACV